MPSEILAIVNGPPSKENWSRLFAATDDWPRDPAASTRLVADAEEGLSRWPEALRAAVLTESEQSDEDSWMWGIDPAVEWAPWSRLVRHVVASVADVSAVPSGAELERVCFPVVRSLRLRHTLASFEEAAATVARFPSLRSLDFSSAHYAAGPSESRHGWSALLRALGEMPLRQLSLERAALGTREIAQLVASPVAARLEALDISNSAFPLGVEGARQLAAWPTTSRLKTLRCANDSLGDDGAIALNGGFLDQIVELDLSGNGVGDPFVRSLVERPNAAALDLLKLGGARLTTAGMRSFLKTPRLSSVSVLGLSDCQLSDLMIEALLDSGAITASLVELDLRGNLMTDRSIDRWLVVEFGRLCVLRLEKNRLTRGGAERLEAWARERGVTCTTRPLR